jgi:acyl carrier protein
MITFDEVKVVIGEVLQLDDERVHQLDSSTGLLGSLPEFDSTTVIALISALETRFDIVIEDDEISAEVFETAGNVYEFVRSKEITQNASSP